MPKPIGNIVEGPLGWRMPERVAVAMEAAIKSAPAGHTEPRRVAKVADEFSLPAGSRQAVGTITTDDVDRDDEVVLPGGIDRTGYNGTVTFAHKYDELPVGRNLWIKPKRTAKGNGLVAATQYATRPDDWVGPWLPDALISLQRENMCRGFSIGFVPKSVRDPTSDEIKERPDWKGKTIIPTWSLLEYAVCSIPCNASAELEAVAKGFDADPAEVLAAAEKIARRETPIIIDTKADDTLANGGPADPSPPEVAKPDLGMGAKHSYGCCMLSMPGHIADACHAMAAKIPDEHLAPDAREGDPHVTLKYGLHDSVSDEAVRAAMDGVPPVRLTLGKAAHFPAGSTRKSDVVHVGVHGDDAQAIHDKLSALPNTDPNSADGYKPHLTLAYVMPGKGKDHDGMDDLDGVSVVSDRLCFSDASGKRTDILLTGRKALAVAVTKDIGAAGEGTGSGGGFAVADRVGPPACPKCESIDGMTAEHGPITACYRCAKCDTLYRVKDDGTMEEMAKPAEAKAVEPPPVLSNPRCDLLAIAAKGLIDHDADAPQPRAGTTADYLAITVGPEGRPAYLYPVGVNGKASAKLVAKALADATAAGHADVAAHARRLADEVAKHPKVPPTYVSPETIRQAVARKAAERQRALLKAAEHQLEDRMARLLGTP